MLITKNHEGLRLDKFTSQVLNLPHALVSRLIRKKNIKVNGLKAEISTRLKEGDIITIPQSLQFVPKEVRRGEAFVSEKMMQEFESSIIYECEEFFAINKPSGLATQGGTKIGLSVDDFLFYMDAEYRLVHRLDKETSGVLIIAKTRLAASKIAKDFLEKNIEKTYLAVVNGAPSEEEGVIDGALLKEFSGVVVDNEDGKPSLTKFKVLKKFGNFALLEVKIETGRMHQIRVHLASINCFIVGDKKYGDVTSDLALKIAPKMLLHASKVKYEGLEIEAKLPDYFVNLI